MITADQILASLNDDQRVIELGSDKLRETDESYQSFLKKTFGSIDVGTAFATFAREHCEATMLSCATAGDDLPTSIGIAIFQGLAIGYRYGRDHVMESDLPL
jgi:6-phosphogluconate dehydrogenase (decarboxylating)